MRWVRIAIVFVLALVASIAIGQPPRPVGDRPDCVTAQATARSDGIGYRHVVHVANTCDYAVDCRVSTDVNPQIQTIHLAPGGSTDVMTFLSSPASSYVARVECPSPRGHTPVIEDHGE